MRKIRLKLRFHLCKLLGCWRFFSLEIQKEVMDCKEKLERYHDACNRIINIKETKLRAEIAEWKKKYEDISKQSGL